jgi:ABC-type dipeptide/oligopeptide/nickel transport system ATPase component
MAIFQRLNREEGMTIVFVTHDPRIAQHTRRVISIYDGQIVNDEPVKEQIIEDLEHPEYAKLVRATGPEADHVTVS